MSREPLSPWPAPDGNSAARHHPAQPASTALRPGDDWHPPQPLPEVRSTPAPLLTATGITLIALGAVWPTWFAAVPGAVAVVAGVWLWVREGVSSWRAWQVTHPEERP
jgi:hypothetical protein